MPLQMQKWSFPIRYTSFSHLSSPCICAHFCYFCGGVLYLWTVRRSERTILDIRTTATLWPWSRSRARSGKSLILITLALLAHLHARAVLIMYHERCHNDTAVYLCVMEKEAFTERCIQLTPNSILEKTMLAGRPGDAIACNQGLSRSGLGKLKRGLGKCCGLIV